ncbi:hypothetical protein [Pelagibacterium limicola]|uniref:hypothetical protein n=1 Tax=Pelagibacterium limicola TaxID=2791022 RepID=UPI0018AFCB80|nr:hypothetical protein [Pelagibacterium limicola]
MLKGKPRAGVARETLPRTSAGGAPKKNAGEPLGLEAFNIALDHVLVDPPVHHHLGGAVDRDLAKSIWTWIARDIAHSEVARLVDAIDSGAEPRTAFLLMIPEFLERLRENAAHEKEDYEAERRNTLQMGGEDARMRLPYLIMAMRRHALLEQAINFGKAIGKLQDEATISAALQSISISNQLTRALWMQAMVGHMANPSRVMAAVTKLSGGNTEVHIANAGYAPLVEAILSHAQNQIGKLSAHSGMFADHDLACKSIDRFHRLMRAINYNLEIERKSLWGTVITNLTARFSERLERPMKEISLHVTQALRRPRDGADSLDPGDVLMALNSLYLLLTIRKSRDSLAVNALLDKAWNDTGQAVEVLVTRALDHYRANPTDPVARERIDAGIKMAEIRYNPEYAEVLRRARDGADRRMAQG